MIFKVFQKIPYQRFPVYTSNIDFENRIGTMIESGAKVITDFFRSSDFTKKKNYSFGTRIKYLTFGGLDLIFLILSQFVRIAPRKTNCLILTLESPNFIQFKSIVYEH